LRRSADPSLTPGFRRAREAGREPLSVHSLTTANALAMRSCPAREIGTFVH
jgi:hypothetical protein